MQASTSEQHGRADAACHTSETNLILLWTVREAISAHADAYGVVAASVYTG